MTQDYSVEQTGILNPLLPEPSDSDGRFIILASHGRTATNWILRSLNAHPDIFCTHTSFGVHYNPETKKTDAPKEYFEMIAKMEAEGRIMPLDEYFDLHEEYINSKHYASVHNFQISPLVNECKLKPPRRYYTVINIIRHPVTRVESIVSRISYEVLDLKIERLKKHFLNTFENQGLAEIVEFIRVQFNPDFEDFRNLAFMAALWTIMVEIQELAMNFHHVPMERFASDPEYFSHVFKYITGGNSEITEDYLDTIFTQGRPNATQTGQSGQVSVGEVYESLPLWKKAAWQKMADNFDLAAIYRPYDYDWSFI